MESERNYGKESRRSEEEIRAYREIARSNSTPLNESTSEKDIEAFEDYVNGNGGVEYPIWLENLRDKRISREDYESLIERLNAVDYHGIGLDSEGKKYSTIDDVIDMAQTLHVPRDKVVSVLESYVKKSSSGELSKSVKVISGRLEEKLYGFLKRADVSGYTASEVVDGDGFGIKYDVSVGENKDNLNVRVSYVKDDEKKHSENHLFNVIIGKKKLEEVPSLKDQVRTPWSRNDIALVVILYPLIFGVTFFDAVKGDGDCFHDVFVLPFLKAPMQPFRKAVHGIKSLFRGNEVYINTDSKKYNLEEYLTNVIASCDGNSRNDEDGINEKAKMIKFAFENMDSALNKDLDGVSKFLSDWRV